jgi:hypothetical protein
MLPNIRDRKVDRLIAMIYESPTIPEDTLEFYEGGRPSIVSTLNKWDKHMSEKYYRDSESTPLELRTELTIFDHICDAWNDFCGWLMLRNLKKYEVAVARVRANRNAKS